MEKLSIVVTCTGRKARPPEPGLAVRSLPELPLGERCALWRERVTAAKHRVPLDRLYQGDAWTQARRLTQTARGLGFDPRTFVVSAGLGLRPVGGTGPSYAATFAPGEPDSVSATGAGAQAWWEGVAKLPESVATADLPLGPVLLVLSAAYAAALKAGLEALGESHEGRVLLFGGSGDVEGFTRIAADRRLRQALGGTATTLNVRAANAYLASLNGRPFTDPTAVADWDRWAAVVGRKDDHDRRRVSDAEVRRLVAGQRRRDPDVSRTRALRALRDAGLACEQARFAALFAEAVPR